MLFVQKCYLDVATKMSVLNRTFKRTWKCLRNSVVDAVLKCLILLNQSHNKIHKDLEIRIWKSINRTKLRFWWIHLIEWNIRRKSSVATETLIVKTVEFVSMEWNTSVSKIRLQLGCHKLYQYVVINWIKLWFWFIIWMNVKIELNNW